MFVESFMLWS